MTQQPKWHCISPERGRDAGCSSWSKVQTPRRSRRGCVSLREPRLADAAVWIAVEGQGTELASGRTEARRPSRPHDETVDAEVEVRRLVAGRVAGHDET